MEIAILTILFLLFAACAVAIYFYFDSSKYEKSRYSRTTGYSYFKVRFDAGLYGEYLSFNILDEIPGNKKILTNIYLPKEKGGTTEVDVVMIHEKGIFVIESKNYSGWIYGSENSRTWTQTFKSGRKEKFYNPIWQNQTHIRTLMQVLNIKDKRYLKSIVAFSERCTIKKLELVSEDANVINRNYLRKAVIKIIKSSDVNLSAAEIQGIYNRLMRYTNVSEDVKAEHIKRVSGYKG